MAPPRGNFLATPLTIGLIQIILLTLLYTVAFELCLACLILIREVSTLLGRAEECLLAFSVELCCVTLFSSTADSLATEEKHALL